MYIPSTQNLGVTNGISVTKVLDENGVKDPIILEASDHIDNMILKENFSNVTVELRADWIVEVCEK